MLGVKECLCKRWLVSNLVCAEAGVCVYVWVGVCVCKSVEIEQKGVKWVDASGMAVRVHAEKVVSAEEGAYGKCWAQKRQMRTYFCLEGAGNRGENVKKCHIPGARTGRKA